jgi:hypothetical protein
MAVIPALTIGAIGAGAIANTAGAFAGARQLYNPDKERDLFMAQAQQREILNQQVQAQRAAQAGITADVQAQGREQAAIMGAQGAYGGREQLNTALALQDIRGQQEAALAAVEQQARLKAEAEFQQEKMELAQLKDDARGTRIRGVAGALGTAAAQAIPVFQQGAAMNLQQSYFDAMIKGFAKQQGARQAQAAAATALEMGMVGGLQPGGPVSAVGAASPVAGAPAYIPGVDYR